MSIGSLGTIGSVTSGQLQQSRHADSDRTVQDSRTQRQSADSAKLAEAAAGIGQTAEDSETSERDADGRRLWERPTHRASDGSSEETGERTQQSIDPSGAAGTQVDLQG